MDKLKIGIICYPTYGGSGVVATSLGKLLAKQGHEVHVISDGIPVRTNLDDDLYFHQVQSFSYELFRSDYFILNLAATIAEVTERQQLDVLHCHYAVPHTTAALLARQLLPECIANRVKIVTTLHGTDITLLTRDPSYYRIIKHAINSSDAITAVSKWLADETVRIFKTPKPIEVVYNFVPPDLKINPKRVEHYRNQLAPCGEKLILHVSNYRPVKNAPLTVEILQKLVSKLSVKLVLAGDGSELGKTIHLAEKLGVLHRVMNIGSTDDLASIMSACDIFLSPSKSDSFGLAALEAMSVGRVPVATAVGGVPEVIQHGVTGYLTEDGDVDKLAEYCELLLTNDRLRQKVGCAGKRFVNSHFSPEKAVNHYLDIYNRIST